MRRTSIRRASLVRVRRPLDLLRVVVDDPNLHDRRRSRRGRSPSRRRQRVRKVAGRRQYDVVVENEKDLTSRLAHQAGSSPRSRRGSVSGPNDADLEFTGERRRTPTLPCSRTSCRCRGSRPPRARCRDRPDRARLSKRSSRSSGRLKVTTRTDSLTHAPCQRREDSVSPPISIGRRRSAAVPVRFEAPSITAAPSASGSFGGTTTPEPASASGRPPTFVVTTGFRNIAASGMTPLCDADRYGRTTRSLIAEQARDVFVRDVLVEQANGIVDPELVDPGLVRLDRFEKGAGHDKYGVAGVRDSREGVDQVAEALVRPDVPEKQHDLCARDWHRFASCHFSRFATDGVRRPAPNREDGERPTRARRGRRVRSSPATPSDRAIRRSPVPSASAGERARERKAFVGRSVVTHEDTRAPESLPRSSCEVPGRDARDRMPPLDDDDLRRLRAEHPARAKPSPRKPRHENGGR